MNTPFLSSSSVKLAEVAARQLSGVAAKWVLPLDKSLGSSLPRSVEMEQDMLHGQYVSKYYHKGNRMQVRSHWLEYCS
jgi:hypothetical protein